MPKLQPAGILSQFTSLLFPKQLDVHVRTTTLENGQVEVTPVFTIDGDEVPAELVGAEPAQSIMGYRVHLHRQSYEVQRQTQARPTVLSKRKAGEFLQGLARTGIDLRSKDGRVHSRITDVKPAVSLILDSDDQLRVDSELTTADGIVVQKPANLGQLREDDGWYAVGDDLLKIATTEPPLDEVLLPEDGNRTLTDDDVPRFLKLLRQHSDSLGDVDKNDRLQPLAVFGENAENRAKVDGDADTISVAPSLVFQSPQGREYEQSPDDLKPLDEKGGGFRRVQDGWIEVSTDALDRHRQACDELRAKLGDSGDIRGAQIPKVLGSLVQAARRDGAWKTPWAVYFSKAVKDSHRLVESPAKVEFRLNIVESDGRSLLELDPIYNHERFRLSHSETHDAALSGDEWVRRKDAWVKVDLDKYAKVSAAAQVLGLQRNEAGFTFPAIQREQVLDLFSVLGSIQHSTAYADFLAKLADFERIEETRLPMSLRSSVVVRGYQQHGFNWLAFLHKFGLNGVLADDMGLGKTLQTLAIIERAKEASTSRFPSLIICPTSIVHNWHSEAQKFFTDTLVIRYTGSKRETKLKNVEYLIRHRQNGLPVPLVVTTYDIARRDYDALNRIPWSYVVVDEGHQIKNPDAERTKAIKTINGQHKLALTGTPIQNNLEELWSLLDFAMPGFLGTRTKFRQQYGNNGRVNWTAVQGGKAPLKERVHPFILRRLKQNVATDLPPKTIVDHKVELSGLQVSLYKEVIEGVECRRVLDEVNEKGVGRAKPLILAAYTRLRTICNHPSLADESRQGQPICHEDSGKLDCLKELIEEIVEGEHRCLLFCQSTKMLDIIQQFFREWNVRTLRLDGSTPGSQRSGLVDEFNGNPAIHCFLISTKAGGTGLNLTGADTVIFYDHDWNPANDSQAQDRAHRIGQTKPVTIYRLVSRGTIEEKIIERQAIKRTLADAIIGTDEEGFKDLTKEELMALFTLDEEDDK